MRGPAPSPGRPRTPREEPEMPLTPRDRRTLMIGGGVLGVLLVGFLFMNVLSGGGDEAIPSLPPITVGPDDGGGGGPTEPSPTGGVSPIPVFTGRDPFSVPPALSPTTSPTTTPPHEPDTSPPARRRRGHRRADQPARRRILAAAPARRSAARPSSCSPCSRAAGSRWFRSRSTGRSSTTSVSATRSTTAATSCDRSPGDCATFLYGDESFTLCANSTK